MSDEDGDASYGGADDGNDGTAVGTMTTPAHYHEAATTGSKATTTKKTSARRAIKDGPINKTRHTM